MWCLVMRRRAGLLVCAVLLLAGCAPPDASAGHVAAERYAAFWLWAGVEPQAVVATAERLYLLQGERVPHRGEAVMQPLGPLPTAMNNDSVWLVFRSETIDHTDEAVQRFVSAMLGAVQRWEHRGTDIDGVQIDFDARTYALKEYADFLRRVRAAMPARYKLGITGLMDWASTGGVETLNDLEGVLDEVVVQTYQGWHTVPDYAAYLPALARLTLPFRVGLIQHGQWDAAWETRLARNPAFRGCVVFLINDKVRL